MTNIEQVFDNPYVRATLYILIFLYIASIRPKLPPFIKVLFLNPVFRVFILFLIVVRGNNDPIFSLALATAFIVTLTYLGEQKAREAFESVDSDNLEKIQESTDLEENFENLEEDNKQSSEKEDLEENFENLEEDNLDEENFSDFEKENSQSSEKELFESIDSDKDESDKDESEGSTESTEQSQFDDEPL
jgi:hypothetical protein